MGLDLAPDPGDAQVVGQDDDAGGEPVESSSALWAPASDEGPLREFADGDEGDRKLATAQPRNERTGQPLLQQGRGDVGVQDT